MKKAFLSHYRLNKNIEIGSRLKSLIQPKTSPKQKQDKPKGPPPVDKLSQHHDYLAVIESMPSPEKEVARACYFLCFLINENRTTTSLFPFKDKVLEKISKSGNDCMMVSYVRRGDRLNYRLTPEAKEKWESETGGKKGSDSSL